MQVERSIDHIEIPELNTISHYIQYQRPLQETHHRFCIKKQNSTCFKNCCVDSIQQPSRLHKPFERTLEEARPRKKQKPMEKQKPKPVLQTTEVMKPKKVEKPTKIQKEKPIEEPIHPSEPAPSTPPPKENVNQCQRKHSEQYLSCCSSCCASSHCSCVEEEEEEESCRPCAKHCSCKHRHRKLCKKCKSSSANCEAEEDPCGEFFDVIREKMEEAIKKSFVDVFGRYFTCCIDKINRLACQVERNEYLLKKVHKDLKDRMSYYDRCNTRKMQYLCDQIKKDKHSCQKHQESSMKFNRCKSKCRYPQTCYERKATSSSDGCQSVSHTNLCNSRCDEHFGYVKSQFQKCGHQNDNGTPKTHSASSSHQSGQSCDEVYINETDFIGPEPKIIQSFPKSEQGTKNKQHRKLSKTSVKGSKTS